MILEDLLSRYPRGREPTLRVNFIASVDGAVTVDGKSAALGGPDMSGMLEPLFGADGLRGVV